MTANKFRWLVCVEERQGLNPVSIALLATQDPAEAWVYLMSCMERCTHTRIFYVKEYGRRTRWTDFRKTVRHLFRTTRRRYYRRYEDFVDYASGKSRPKYQPPPPDDETDHPLALPLQELPETPAQPPLFEITSVWRHKPPTKRRL